MKPAHSPQAATEAPARVDFQVQFSGGPGRHRAHDGTAPSVQTEAPASSARANASKPVQEVFFGRIPKITRLLVLGHHFEKLVREGAVKDYAGIARLTGLSRARVTQITNLTLLAPSVQENLLALLPGREARKFLTEHETRFLTAPLDWEEQQRIWALLRPGDPDSTQP